MDLRKCVPVLRLQPDLMNRLPRSPLLLEAATSALLVVDIQEKLLPLIPSRSTLVWNTRRLIDAASLLEVPVAATEQYPKGLGPTVAELAERLPPAEEKIFFSCAECGGIFERWKEAGRFQIVVAGMETHVCVQQTGLDLMAAGFDVFLCIDALGARHALDHDTALRRLESNGATLTTCESVLFEWCERAGTDVFRKVSQLVRESPPTATVDASGSDERRSP